MIFLVLEHSRKQWAVSRRATDASERELTTEQADILIRLVTAL
jgi:hypothetical protein